MKKKTLIPVFPGTNCEKESFLWFSENLETEVEFLNLKKHHSIHPEEIDALFIPGGFSFGDYLRAGAIAARTEEMTFVKELAQSDIPILGICNGFQILCESGLLPGTLVKNVTKQHHHFPVSIRVEKNYFLTSNQENKCVWIPKFQEHQLKLINTIFSKEFFIPMSCGMGNWLPPRNNAEKVLAEKNAVVFYNNNENGSYKSIAGLTNSSGKIFGMMPHPERASDLILGSDEGLVFLLGIAQSQKIKIRSGSPLANFAEKLFEGAKYHV